MAKTMTTYSIYEVVREYAGRLGLKIAPHDLRRYAESRDMPNQNATAWPAALWNGC
jgi:hypothetical protein